MVIPFAIPVLSMDSSGIRFTNHSASLSWYWRHALPLSKNHHPTKSAFLKSKTDFPGSTCSYAMNRTYPTIWLVWDYRWPHGCRPEFWHFLPSPYEAEPICWQQKSVRIWLLLLLLRDEDRGLGNSPNSNFHMKSPDERHPILLQKPAVKPHRFMVLFDLVFDHRFFLFRPDSAHLDYVFGDKRGNRHSFDVKRIFSDI